MKKVFIVHGRDSEALHDLRNLLLTLKVEPIILRDEDQSSLTLIEKFEQRASQADFAIILLTPDDQARGDELLARARQNVVFEMGWFFSRLGRDGTLLLHGGHMELPSDITGILYLSFKEKPSELKDDIIRELENGGVSLHHAERAWQRG